MSQIKKRVRLKRKLLVRGQRWKAGKTLEAEEVLWWLKGDFFLGTAEGSGKANPRLGSDLEQKPEDDQEPECFAEF
jgi:hypothetical protein